MNSQLCNRSGKSLGFFQEGLKNDSNFSNLVFDGISDDSRDIAKNFLFLACSGVNNHGVKFVFQAIEKGASAIAYDLEGLDKIEMNADYKNLDNLSVPSVSVKDLRAKAGTIASQFFGAPSEDMFVIGITGTNGKTSCCYFLSQLLSRGDVSCGMIGTIGIGSINNLRVTENTTPGAIKIQKILSGFVEANMTDVVMEVSSHGLDQGRVNGVDFDLALFTNLSHEHMDYHQTISAYAEAKQTLFRYERLRYAVSNIKQEFGRKILSDLSAGVAPAAYLLLQNEGEDQNLIDWAKAQDYQLLTGKIVKSNFSGIEMVVESSWGNGLVFFPVVGDFNAENILAVMAVLLVRGYEFSWVLKNMQKVKAAPGRMELFGKSEKGSYLMVDYAHTPDALESVLKALRAMSDRKVCCVFGCGGNRDRSKRPLMGGIAENYADLVVLTNDNPRDESPEAIVNDILSGMCRPSKAEIILDRAVAIEHATSLVCDDDIVLVAGKGHEEYQEADGLEKQFSDRQFVSSMVSVS